MVLSDVMVDTGVGTSGKLSPDPFESLARGKIAERGDYARVEHSAIRWSTEADIESLPLAPSDGLFAQLCIRIGNRR